MLRRDGYIIWPAYFDRSLSRSMGRRVPINLAIRSPTVERLADAARRLGLKIEIEAGAYPRNWYRRTGRLVVKADRSLSKQKIIKMLAEKLAEIEKGKVQ